VESPNSRVVIVLDFDEITLTSSVPHLPTIEVSSFHVIFYLNGIMIAICFDKGSCIVNFYPKLKEFL